MMEFLNENRFMEKPFNRNQKELQEEIMAEDWEKLLNDHHGKSTIDFLREIFIELNFSVGEGQSKNPEVQLALKRGLLPLNNQSGWIPDSPDGIKVYLHPTPAGRIPVIECESDLDFISLQQSLANRLEPVAVPDSRGASIIKNYNNWVRVNMHRDGLGIPKDPAMYRDYIILLSYKNYSGVSAEILGFDDVWWRKQSLIIRREHEAAHYMCQRFYNSAKNEIHDEIIADFMGLTAAFGEYDPYKFLTFLGLEKYPDYRIGGRLENYLPPENAVCKAVYQSALNIARYYKDTDRISMFHTLCRTSVADMAKGKFS